jgi:predicted P-loop ATPase
VVRELFGGDEWYMDAQRSPAEKDFYQDIVGKWGVEIGEMAAFSKADYNKIKQTLTAQADTYRPSYGRYSRTFPRQCIFVGTTNDDSWQRDPTGGRRFLPVRVGNVNVAGIAEIRDQLWAEAVTRVRRGESWWQAPERAQAEQDARYAEDSWSDPIQRWLAGKCPGAAYESMPKYSTHSKGHVLECTTTEILSRALHIDLARHDRAAQMRVAAILQRLGWPKYRANVHGTRQYRWYEPDGWTWPTESMPDD